MPLRADLLGEIKVSDLELLGKAKGYEIPAIKRLSERHHALARCIVAGASMSEAALICGYDISRISVLKNDPSFKELIAFYTETKDRAFRDTQSKLAGIASDALDELQTRLEDSPDKIPLDKLMQLVTLGADRTGNGPSSTQNVNMNSGTADRLQSARERLAHRRKTLDLGPEGATSPSVHSGATSLGDGNINPSSRVVQFPKDPPHGE